MGLRWPLHDKLAVVSLHIRITPRTDARGVGTAAPSEVRQFVTTMLPGQQELTVNVGASDTNRDPLGVAPNP